MVVLGVVGMGAGGHEDFRRGCSTDEGSWAVAVMVTLVLETMVGWKDGSVICLGTH